MNAFFRPMPLCTPNADAIDSGSPAASRNSQGDDMERTENIRITADPHYLRYGLFGNVLLFVFRLLPYLERRGIFPQWEIGAELYISETTVKFHLRNIMRKMDASSRAEVVYEASKLGVI